jgi:hypothetical protein
MRLTLLIGSSWLNDWRRGEADDAYTKNAYCA